MYISKKNRELIKQKFNGRCAYSGTVLKDDWEIEHIKPVRRDGKKVMFLENHNFDNLIPVQKEINRYKGGLSLEDFRRWYLGGLHKRLKKLPKNPKTEKGIKRKRFLLEIAGYFGITPNKPFSGKFYFETIQNF